MTTKENQFELMKTPINAYALLALSISISAMLAVSYKEAQIDVLAVSIFLAVGSFAEFIRLMYLRDKALSIIANRRMQKIQLRRAKRATKVLKEKLPSSAI